MPRVIAGAVVWGVATVTLRLTAIESLFLWAPLVVVPLGLDAIAPLRILRLAQPVAALFAVASFAPNPGLIAALLAAPWALLCGGLALLGAWRFFRRRELLPNAALGLIAVGGWGLVMSRAGMKPAGFEEPIVLLTAVHFHYTAFAAPVIAHLAGPRRSTFLAGLAVVVATPMLAIGFTLRAEPMKLIAVLLIAGGLIVLATELIRLAVETRETGPRFLLGIAGFSILWGMALAVLYQVGRVQIPFMAWSHGILNGFGFATCALLALKSAPIMSRSR